MANLLQMMKSISELLVLGRYVITVDFDGEAWQMGVPGMLWYDFIFGGFQEWRVVVVHCLCSCTPYLILSLLRQVRLQRGPLCTLHDLAGALVEAPLQEWVQLRDVLEQPSTGRSLARVPFLEGQCGPSHDCVLPPMVKCLVSPRHPHSNGNTKTCYAPEIFASKDLSRLHLHKEPLMHVSVPIFSYSQGQEMRLWDQLAALDIAEALSIWIVATNGPDGNVVHGLCRMLTKELPAWKIHVVICKAWGSGELRCTKGAREACAVAWEAWWGPGRAKGGQDAWVACR